MDAHSPDKNNNLAKRWCFTLNNYTQEDEDRLRSLTIDDGVNFLIFEPEVGDSGTPHFQGFVKLDKKKRPTQLRKLVGPAHFIVAKGTDQQNIDYCSKDGNPYIYGEKGKGQGKRSDWDNLMADLRAGATEEEVTDKYPSIVAQCRAFVLRQIARFKPKVPYVEVPLRPWQAHLKGLLSAPADPRKIIFIVDLDGNAGKSWFARQYQREMNEKEPGAVAIMTPAKQADMAHTIQANLKCLFMDVARGQSHVLQYPFLEHLKNERLFKPKYDSLLLEIDECPHVVAMMNEDPDVTKLSRDRYYVRYVSGPPPDELEVNPLYIENDNDEFMEREKRRLDEQAESSHKKKPRFEYD